MNWEDGMGRFDGKTAIVTGAANGIGAAIAKRLAEDGARVAVADVELDRAETIAAEIGSDRALPLGVDVRERAAVEGMVASTVARFGAVDVLVACAGIVDRLPFLEFTDELWHRVLTTNLTGTFLCGQAVAREMVKQGRGGRIVNVASNSGFFGGRGRAAYGASKAGIINLTQTMAIELADDGILVNAVSPGATRTRAVSGDVPGPSVMMRAPLKRFADPSEIAAVAAFLASDECSFTTGQVFSADGGFTATGVMEG